MADDITQIGVVYATNSGAIRRFVVPSVSDDELEVYAQPGKGETLLCLPYKDSYRSDGASIALTNDTRVAITEALGFPPHSGRCAVLDLVGTVVNVILADPDCDAAPVGLRFVLIPDPAEPDPEQSDTVPVPVPDIGWTWTAEAGFVAPAGVAP